MKPIERAGASSARPVCGVVGKSRSWTCRHRGGVTWPEISAALTVS